MVCSVLETELAVVTASALGTLARGNLYRSLFDTSATAYVVSIVISISTAAASRSADAPLSNLVQCCSATSGETWAWYTGTTDLETVRRAMQRWTSRYNALRLHTALGYVTPLDALQSFLGT